MKGGNAVDTKAFAAELARSLAHRGVDRDSAIKHAVSLVRTFDEDDLKEISAYTCAEDFSELSDRLADFIKEKDKGQRTSEQKDDEDEDMKIVSKIPSSSQKSDPFMASTVVIPTVNTDKAIPDPDNMKTKIVDLAPAEGNGADNEKTRIIDLSQSNKDDASVQLADPLADNMKTRIIGTVNESTGDNMHTRAFAGIKTEDISLDDIASGDTCVNIPLHDTSDTEAVFEEKEVYLAEDDPENEDNGKVELTTRGKKYFVSITVLASPFLLVFSLIVLTFFGLSIAVICALIVLCLALVCIEAVLGSVLSIVGIIYGAIQIVGGNIGIGLYEMGLGIALGGLAMALGILTYSLASLALPYALKQVISFEGYCFKRIKPMINRFREECNRL